MGTERNAAAAVDTYERRTGVVEIDCVNRAGLGARSTAVAKVHFNNHSSALPLRVGPGGTSLNTGGRVAGKAVPGFEPCR